MSKREHRRLTAEQTLKILREADQPGVTVSEVCRRHGLAASVFSTTKQRKYPSGFKEQALAKVFARSADQTILSVANDLSMNKATLRGWMKAAMRDQKDPPAKSAHTREWTAAQRLLALHESHGLDEEALNVWCRERGLFAHVLTQWRSDFCAVTGAARQREEADELRQLRLTNLQLQRDLNRKDKALAEAAALLVLQKKYRALWAAEDA